MTPKDIRNIQRAAARVVTKMIDVYDEEVPKKYQCDETYVFFYSCVLSEVANNFKRWNSTALEELTFNEEGD